MADTTAQSGEGENVARLEVRAQAREEPGKVFANAHGKTLTEPLQSGERGVDIAARGFLDFCRQTEQAVTIVRGEHVGPTPEHGPEASRRQMSDP